MSAALAIVRVTYPVLVEDLGRPGFAAVGVPRSGAADRGAFRLGNRLLGNPESHASLEITLGNLEIAVTGHQTLALTGADAPALLDGRPVPHAAPFTARDGQRLVLGTPARGLRTYLAVRGGVDVRPTLGSRSNDVLSTLGPPTLTAGSTLAVGSAPTGRFPLIEQAPTAAPAETVRLGVRLGPRHDWFADLGQLSQTHWTVSAQSNRIGIRLEGAPLARSDEFVGRELPSEGMVLGAVQVPPSGQPVILLADHPVTGGYPVIAVVQVSDVDRAAQARPGQLLRFSVVGTTRTA